MISRLVDSLRYHWKLWLAILLGIASLLLNIFAAKYMASVGNLLFMVMYLMFFIGFQLAIWFYAFFYLMAGQIKVTLLMPGDLKYTWADYVGQPELVKRAQKWVQVLKGVSDFEAMGGIYEPGILFEGPPGGGKTYLAKVIASEAGIPFLSVDSASLTATFMGIAPMKVGRLFAKARGLAERFGSAILFIDEIDAIGGSRGRVTATSEHRGPFQQFMGGFAGGGSGLLNTLLIELDGLTERRARLWKLGNAIKRWLYLSEFTFLVPRLMVIGSTNMPDVLDPALTRPGRLGMKIAVRKPQFDGMVQICQYYIDKVKCDETLKATLVAHDSYDETPAFVKMTLNNAALIAFQGGAKLVGYRHWGQVLAESKMGGIRQPTTREEEDVVQVAVHEASHAALGWKLLPANRWAPRVATIIPYGPTGGHVDFQKVRPIGKMTHAELIDRLTVGLGGTVSEAELLGFRMMYSADAGDLKNMQLVALELAREGAWGWEFALLTPFAEIPEGLRKKVGDALNVADTRVRQLMQGGLWLPTLRLATVLLDKGEVFGEDVAKALTNEQLEIDPRILKYLQPEYRERLKYANTN